MIRRALTLVLIPAALCAQNFDTITIKLQPLRGGVYMLTGSGGNMGLSVGKDAAFLVDDQFAPLTPKILAAIATVTQQPVKFVLNTHWHFDHTGGNENLGKAGSLIVAHANVRKRMSTEQFIERLNRRFEPAPPAALPVVTFNDSVTFHINGDDLVAFKVPPAHTDGDAVVHFTKANVIHMGDLFMGLRYPFIDLSSGGNVNGVIAGADRALAVCNAETHVIPGHGPLATCATLKSYRDMLVSVRDRVQQARRQGRTLEQVLAAKVTADFDATFSSGFISADAFVRSVYESFGVR